MVATFELKDRPGVIRGRDRKAEALDYFAGEGDLLHVRLREAATASPEAVLEADADIAPSAAAWAAMRSWLAPAPRTDQRKASPNRRSAVRFMCATSSGCGPIPPRRPKTDWTKKGGFTRPRSAKCARL